MADAAIAPGRITESLAHMMAMNPAGVAALSPFMSGVTRSMISQPIGARATGIFAVPQLVERSEPRGSSSDTVCMPAIDPSVRTVPPMERRFPRHSASIHRVAGLKFISDDEILRVILHPDEFHHETDGVRFGWTRYGRSMVQQVGYRGCGAACVAMLQLDHGIAPDWDWVRRNNLSSDELRADMLKRSGLSPVTERLSRQSAGDLEHLLRQYYSGIISIGGELGGHVAVLDYFSTRDNLAVLREPFHGWSIATYASAVLNRGPSDFMGVALSD